MKDTYVGIIFGATIITVFKKYGDYKYKKGIKDFYKELITELDNTFEKQDLRVKAQ